MDNSTPKIAKETKKKIRVEFDRTPLKERMKAKFLNFYFFQTVVIKLFRFIFLLGIAYVVLFPFFSKIAGSFMGREDFIDVTVRLIPKNFTIDIYKAIWVHADYTEALLNTTLISVGLAVLQTFVCCFIAYGLAKYKFRGNGIVFLLVMITMIIPHRTLASSMSMNFTYFDICGILSFLSGGASVGIESIDQVLSQINVFGLAETLADNSINLKNTIWPFIILASTGLAFKNGLYVFMLRQFFRGIPDSLEESAYIDGSGDFKTFIQIILPMSVPMMITVFLFAFCWQWTDTFYTGMFFTSPKEAPLMLSSLDLKKVFSVLDTEYAGQNLYETAIRNTSGIMIIAPLVIVYIFLQRYLVEGIERSGLTAE
ncbi:MAG: carbohydrate ABC transporter permease [Ruminococcaceae bacterium]|nr:carbohydrate ABC transporter permease [Oscillospiraceae bacterium]